MYQITDLENYFPINYEFEGKDRIYFPDFLVKPKNLIVEIKSSWTYDNNGKNKDLRNINDKKWEAAKSLDDYNFPPLKSKDEIKLYFELLNKNLI